MTTPPTAFAPADTHVLVTGAAGFIGFHLVRQLARAGYRVTGLDNINDYYAPRLKYRRLAELGIEPEKVAWGREVYSGQWPDLRFIRQDLHDKQALLDLFAASGFNLVVNLAAQAGVRYSIENPDAYIGANIVGFYNLLEACRHHPVGHLVFASSSSVYGDSQQVPFRETARVDYPVSLYAATKKSNELMAFTYSHLYSIPVTGLRFFTVYGPWGRPDMALSLFTEKIWRGQPIQVFNHGRLARDFTYIDDIVQGIGLTLRQVPAGGPQGAPYQLFNIGNNRPVPLLRFIRAIEEALGKKAVMEYKPMQPGDVHQTWADTTALQQATGFAAGTPVEQGVQAFVEWFIAEQNTPLHD